MTPLEILKSTLHDLLIEKEGNVQADDLIEIKRRAKEIGLDERQLNKLLQEVDANINWESRKKQKEESQKKEDQLKKALIEQRKNEQNAGETLDFILDQCGKDNVFEISEIKVYFETSNDLNQEESISANLLKNYFDKNNYIPLNTPKGKSLKESLESTAWYKDRLPLPPPPPAPPFPWKIVITASVLLIVIGCVLFYTLWFVPYLKDKNAERMYSFSNELILRSSTQAGVNYNLLDKIEYGSELLVYQKSNDWATVKANGKEGYVSTKYLLNKKDFHILNGIFGDVESKETIITAKCRNAVLNYYQRNNIIGKIEPAIQKEVFGSVVNKDVWQIFSKGKDKKPNTIIYGHFCNPTSKFTDFGFIVKNTNTQRRKFVLYSFADDESPVYIYECDAPDVGNIKNVKAFLKDGHVVCEALYTSI